MAKGKQKTPRAKSDAKSKPTVKKAPAKARKTKATSARSQEAAATAGRRGKKAVSASNAGGGQTASSAAPRGTQARRGDGVAPANAATSESGWYFVAQQVVVDISTMRPQGAELVVTAATFDEAREQAIEHLIELIDEAERRFWRLKQAGDFDSYLAGNDTP